MEVITHHPRTKIKPKTIKTMAKDLNISVEEKNTESPYDPEFVKMIKQNREAYKAGIYMEVSVEELEAMCK
jgi:ubiquitin-protein ligase